MTYILGTRKFYAQVPQRVGREKRGILYFQSVLKRNYHWDDFVEISAFSLAYVLFQYVNI